MLKKQELGRCKILTYSIDTEGHQPIKQPMYRTALKHRAIIEEHVHSMLKQCVIRESHSPWASPIVLVQKKSGEIRFCVDFRKLNAVTKKDVYPLPRIDDILDSLGSATYFSTLDLQSGYWQVFMDEVDKEKMAFSSFSGLYEFNVMPFGLCNAPSLFQRIMEIALTGLQWKTCLVYLDDIIIFSQTFPEHLSRSKEVFVKLKQAGMKLKAKKCSFGRLEVQFLCGFQERTCSRPR